MNELPEPPDLLSPSLDELRASDFAHLDEAGHRYFDYTGAGLAARRQVDAAHSLLSSHTLGNPHRRTPRAHRRPNSSTRPAGVSWTTSEPRTTSASSPRTPREH
ncbi:MAG: hypothetical protein R2789_08255 [Microthrixaceae bacterium]